MPPSLLEQDSSTDRGSEETPSLVVAVLADDVQEVRRVLEAQPDTASSLHSQARMALHLAMTGKRKAGVEVVRALLGAHVGAAKHKDRCGAMPLHKAVQGKRAGAAGKRAPQEVVDALLQAFPAGAGMQDNEGKTPLHVALEGTSGGIDLVTALLKADAGAAKLKDVYGATALCRAVAGETASLEVVEALLEANPEAATDRAELKEDTDTSPRFKKDPWKSGISRQKRLCSRKSLRYTTLMGRVVLHHALRGTPAGIAVVERLLTADPSSTCLRTNGCYASLSHDDGFDVETWRRALCGYRDSITGDCLTALHFAVAGRTASVEVVERLLSTLGPQAAWPTPGIDAPATSNLDRPFPDSMKLPTALNLALEGFDPAGIQVVRAILKACGLSDVDDEPHDASDYWQDPARHTLRCHLRKEFEEGCRSYGYTFHWNDVQLPKSGVTPLAAAVGGRCASIE
eukprot:1525449-Rhodomonas_salina.1